MPTALMPERDCILVSSTEVPRQSNENQVLSEAENWDMHNSLELLSHGDLDSAVIKTGRTAEFVGRNRDFTPPVSVVTNVNGYWKQERFFANSAPLSAASVGTNLCPAVNSDSGSEQPARKHQLLLEAGSPSSSEKEYEEQKSVVSKKVGVGGPGRFSRLVIYTSARQ